MFCVNRLKIKAKFFKKEKRYEILQRTSPCLTTGDSSSLTIKLSKPTDFKAKAGCEKS